MNILSDSDLLVIKIVDGQPEGLPITYSNFRLINPQTSFPDLPDNSFLVDFGYYVFKYVNRPVPAQFENVNQGPIVFDAAKDAWTNSWAITPYTPEQMDQARQMAWDGLRGQRNMFLAMSDWTQLPDVPLTPTQVDAWRVYRQQLRDYMGTVTDPFNPPAWPVPPAS